MKEIYKKLRKELKTTSAHEEAVADYIAWQLDTMQDQALAETTAKELTDGTFLLKNAVSAIRKAAEHGICSYVDAFREVRKYLKIDGVVSDAQAALYFLRDIPRETVIELLGLIRNYTQAVAAVLDLGLDDLFGEG